MKRPPDSLGTMTNFTPRVVAPTILLLAVGAAACGRGNTEQTPQTGSQLSQVIVADGSSTVFPITEAVAEEFQTAHKGHA